MCPNINDPAREGKGKGTPKKAAENFKKVVLPDWIKQVEGNIQAAENAIDALSKAANEAEKTVVETRKAASDATRDFLELVTKRMKELKELKG